MPYPTTLEYSNVTQAIRETRISSMVAQRCMGLVKPDTNAITTTANKEIYAGTGRYVLKKGSDANIIIPLTTNSLRTVSP